MSDSSPIEIELVPEGRTRSRRTLVATLMGLTALAAVLGGFFLLRHRTSVPGGWELGDCIVDWSDMSGAITRERVLRSCDEPHDAVVNGILAVPAGIHNWEDAVDWGWTNCDGYSALITENGEAHDFNTDEETGELWHSDQFNVLCYQYLEVRQYD